MGTAVTLRTTLWSESLGTLCVEHVSYVNHFTFPNISQRTYLHRLSMKKDAISLGAVEDAVQASSENTHVRGCLVGCHNLPKELQTGVMLSPHRVGTCSHG